MSAPLNPNQLGRAYYHGTGGALRGATVEARAPEAYFPNPNNTPGAPDPLVDKRAYATEKAGDAARWAGHKAARQGRLFGSVYEVTPRTEYGRDEMTGLMHGIPSPTGVPHHIADRKGLDVVRHAAFASSDGELI